MKILKYLALLFVSLIWIVALSPELSSKMTLQDSYRFGDLYRLSNLSKFRDLRQQCAQYSPPKRTESTQKKIHLYLVGDSFTEEERLGKKDFAVDAYTYVHWTEALHIKPDTSEISILILESVERHFREKFTKMPIQNLIPDTATFIVKGPDPSFMNRLDDAFRAKSTELRLDGLLFQNDFILSLKQLKADFNYKFFDRTNKEVVPVNNGNDIVYYMDTDTPELTSSFSRITKSAIDSMVNNVNQSKKLALQMGFDAVALSIIPNKVSVLMPAYDTYNQLIDRVYKHRNLDVPYIDVYHDFRKMGDKAYRKGDSHWTCEGQYLWLNKTNALIAQLASGPDR